MAREQPGGFLLESPLPLGDLYRMHPILRSQFVDRLVATNGRERHLRFELATVLPTRATHGCSFYPSSSPTLVNLCSGPVFGVHYTMYTMVSPLQPGHPSVGMPPVYSPRNLAAPTATSMIASLTSISSPHPGQRYRYSSGGGPKGSSSPSCGSGSWCLRRILPSPYGFQLIMDYAIGGVPDPPHLHVMVTVRTA